MMRCRTNQLVRNILRYQHQLHKSLSRLPHFPNTFGGGVSGTEFSFFNIWRTNQGYSKVTERQAVLPCNRH